MPNRQPDAIDAVDNLARLHATHGGATHTEPSPLSRHGALATIVKELSPAYFAMVMATGIVSVSAHLLGMVQLASVLFVLNVAVYAVIWLLFLLRLWWFRPTIAQDLTDHQRGPGFFTAVAASCILGNQFGPGG